MCIRDRSNPIGYFEFDRVPVGNWVIREIAAPEAYVLSEETFPVEITEDGQTIEITMENQIIRGTVAVSYTHLAAGWAGKSPTPSPPGAAKAPFAVWI